MSTPIDHQAIAAAKALNALNELEIVVLDETAEPISKPLPLPLLEAITDGFSKDREIGRGGFSVVYQGILENQKLVAVKRLSPLSNMDENNKFVQETECLMKARHKNVVRFFGYCAESHGNFLDYKGKPVIADAIERLLCFEYVSPGNLRNYIDGSCCKVEWRTWYQIINGICQGLNYLHEKNIIHLDLKPENVLLDKCMVPKITDFGISRCFGENETTEYTSSISGTLGYLAPERIHGKITNKSDIYSLGIIIIEILTGSKFHLDDDSVEEVLESWRARLVEEGLSTRGKRSVQELTQFEQIRLCIDIARQCCHADPAMRPVTQTIIERLQEFEPAENEVVYGLNVYPPVLYFPRAPVTLVPSPLYLTNNTDKHVAFRLVEKPKIRATCCFENLPLYGIVEPRSTYSLVVRTDKPREEYTNLILQSCTPGDAHIPQIQSNYSMLHRIFEGNMVDTVVLKAVATRAKEGFAPCISHVCSNNHGGGHACHTSNVTALQLSPPAFKILQVQKIEGDKATCFDVNQTKEWVITGHTKGFVRIWNYLTKRKLHSFKVSNVTVNSVKFVERKNWFVVASDDGFIHFYDYETKMYKVTSFRGESILAVHPSQPYVLSASYSQRRGLRVIEGDLWDWDKNRKCTKTFEIGRGDWPSQVAFNPKETKTFAIAFRELHIVEVRTIIDRPKTSTLSKLCGHTGGVNSLDFFTLEDQQYLITGSDDCSAKIWDMQKHVCIYTLQASVFPIISVLFHPSRQILITGSEDGTVYFWSSTNFRLERVINAGACWDRGLRCFAYSMSSTGVLIFGGERTIAVMEESRLFSGPQFNADIGRGDTTTDQFILRDSDLLDVHPLDVCFPSSSDQSTVQMVHLTNKTDERVAFRLLKKEGNCLEDHYGIIISGCTYTLTLTAECLDFGENTNLDLLLQSIISGDNCIVPLHSISQCYELFEELRETKNSLHEVALRVVLHPQGDVTNKIMSHPMSPSSTILDAHPTETWILKVCHQYVAIADVVTEDVISDFRLETTVECGKFIARMQWLLVGTYNGFIHVYSYETKEMKKITSFQASTSSVRLMVIHPTLPYVLSTSEDREMSLWKWDVKGWNWKCTRTYDGEHPNTICQVTFNPKDTNSFASASRDRTVKVWSLGSPTSKYTLFGHPAAVTCLDFFTRGDKQYLVSGSDDGFVRIWDLQTRACVHTTDLMPPVRSLTSLPDRGCLLIGFEDCTVDLWSSAHFRSERIFNFGACGKPVGSVHLMASGRFVAQHGDYLLVMDIDNVEPAATKLQQ